MLLTKENLIRYLRERKYLLPIDVSKEFDTTTTIASAALSDITSEKYIGITTLKSGGSPFYYDIAQKKCLEELAEKYLNNSLKDLYNKIKTKKILNENHLSIQEKMEIKHLKDFLEEVEIKNENINLKFFIWYELDIESTKKQIENYFKNKDSNPIKKEEKKEVEKNEKSQVVQKTLLEKDLRKEKTTEETNFKGANTIDDFIQKNNLILIEKTKITNGIKYLFQLKLEDFNVVIEGILFDKKITQKDIIQFYVSTQKPKIVFTNNISKSLISKFTDFENLSIVNIN